MSARETDIDLSKLKTAITFDDVLLVPKVSSFLRCTELYYFIQSSPPSNHEKTPMFELSWAEIYR
jgi:hypothetical protein